MPPIDWNQMSWQELMSYLLPVISHNTDSPTTSFNRLQDVADITFDPNLSMMTGATAAPMYSMPAPFDPSIYTPTLDSYRMSDDPVWSTAAQGIYIGDPSYTRASVLQSIRNKIQYNYEDVTTGDEFITDQVNKMFDEVANLRVAQSDYQRTMQEDLAKNAYGKMGLPQPTQSWGSGVDEYGMPRLALPEELQSQQTRDALLSFLASQDQAQNMPSSQDLERNIQDWVYSKYTQQNKGSVTDVPKDKNSNQILDVWNNVSDSLGPLKDFLLLQTPLPIVGKWIFQGLTDGFGGDLATEYKNLVDEYNSGGTTPSSGATKPSSTGTENKNKYADQTKFALASLLHTPGYRAIESGVRNDFSQQVSDAQKRESNLSNQLGVYDLLNAYDTMMAEKSGITPTSFALQEKMNKNLFPAFLPFLMSQK